MNKPVLVKSSDLIRPRSTPIAPPISATVTETEIWNRTIRPDVGDLAAGAAREFLRLRLAESDTERVRALSAKASLGGLSAEEAEELDQYLNVGRTLEFIKAKARLSLRDASA